MNSSRSPIVSPGLSSHLPASAMRDSTREYSPADPDMSTKKLGAWHQSDNKHYGTGPQVHPVVLTFGKNDCLILPFSFLVPIVAQKFQITPTMTRIRPLGQ